MNLNQIERDYESLGLNLLLLFEVLTLMDLNLPPHDPSFCKH